MTTRIVLLHVLYYNKYCTTTRIVLLHVLYYYTYCTTTRIVLLHVLYYYTYCTVSRTVLFNVLYYYTYCTITHWKLVDGTQHNKDGTWLFDLSNDLGEINNLAKKYPDIVIRYFFFSFFSHYCFIFRFKKHCCVISILYENHICIQTTCVVRYIHRKHCITRTGNKTGNHTEKLN